MTKLSPLQTTSEKLGAQFTDREGWRVAASYANVDEEIAAAREHVALSDETPNGKIFVEGKDADSVLRDVFGLTSLAIGLGAAIGQGYAYRLRHDMFFVSTPAGVEESALDKLMTGARTANQFVTVTDVTHGNAELRVVGAASRELLSKLCGLDFHPDVFANHAAKQSSLAKTTQLIIRRDIGLLPAFSIIGARSLGAYVWEALMRAGREWNILPVGRAALEMLEGKNNEH